MKEASWYNKLKKNNVKCLLCPKNCIIPDSKFGFCGVRKNIGGKLYTTVYEQPVSINLDPIEKKPLFHFLPASKSLSFGTVGCNLDCMWCQNWEISKLRKKEFRTQKFSPQKIIDIALEKKAKSISYTYNEPTIFYEYLIECAMLAKEEGIKNVFVSNGFINKEPLNELCNYIDAANIDLKSFNNEFYLKYCSAMLENVLESLKIIKKRGIWLEITNLIIPTLNDDFKEIEEMCIWIKENLGRDTPLHFSRFFPMHRMQELYPTPEETLKKAQEIGKKYLDYVYLGNISIERGENTYCPNCKKLLVGRSGFFVVVNNIREGSCIYCKTKIPGVW